MSQQLFSFEGRFITLAQINMIKEERAKEAEGVKEEVVAKPKKVTAKKEKIEVSKQALERGAEISEEEKEKIAEEAENIDPTTLDESEVSIVDEETGEELPEK